MKTTLQIGYTYLDYYDQEVLIYAKGEYDSYKGIYLKSDTCALGAAAWFGHKGVLLSENSADENLRLDTGKLWQPIAIEGKTS